VSDKVDAWRYVKGVDDISTMTPHEIFNRGFDYGVEDAQAKMKAHAAQADLAGVATILDKFEQRLIEGGLLRKSFKRYDGDMSKLTDRQISNVMHGREPDDNGEFTASSVGAANEKLCVDEGCDHHGTPHVCVSPAANEANIMQATADKTEYIAAVDKLVGDVRKAPPGAKRIENSEYAASQRNNAMIARVLRLLNDGGREKAHDALKEICLHHQISYD
jgi:hypothetical protein